MKWLISILLFIMMLSFISASYIPPSYNNITIVLKASYIPPNYNNITIVLGEEAGGPSIDYSVILPLGFIRFLNCSPDFENPNSIPQGQSDIQNSINATNSGTGSADLQIRINQTAANGWTLFASNQSDLSQNITLSTSWQTIYSAVDDGLYRKIWLFANCSFINSNARTSIEMKV